MGKFDEMQKICLSRGIIFPSAEIYSSLSGFYDYGNVGSLLKRKFIDHWRNFFIKNSDFQMLELDGCVVLPESVFIASGHAANFADPVIRCSKCGSVFRADHLVEEKAGEFVEGKSVQELADIIKTKGIRCQKCGGILDNAKSFNLMLKTEISPSGGQVAYMRPETAQNIFSGFQRIYKTSRAKLPFGVYQIGHSFRNEISPRQFIIRLREFSQCEIEFFFDPENQGCPIGDVNEAEMNFLSRADQGSGDCEYSRLSLKNAIIEKVFPNDWIAYYLSRVFDFYKTLGIPEDCLRIRHLLPEETPHYSAGNYDLEIKFDFGWKETVSNSCRTDHDLKSHSRLSGVDLSVLTDDGKKLIPHVVEPSFGLERTIAAILYHSFMEDKERGWNWFKFPTALSPYTAAIYPLIGKDGLPEKAVEIYEGMRNDFDCFYDEKGSIGKRYARADEIGTRFCITIDHQTLKDNTVTIRDRDSGSQRRVDANQLKKEISVK